MAEQQTTIPDPQAEGGDPAAVSSGEQGASLIAGKYATEADLDQGIAKSVEHLGLGGIARTSFNDIDDKISFYQTLSSQMTQPAATPIPSSTEQASPLAIQKPTDLVTQDMGINEVIEKAGVSREDIAAHFSEHGHVNPKDVIKIQKVLPSFSPTMINDHARMAMNDAKHQGHVNQQITAGAALIAGGEAQLQNLMLFASGLPEVTRNSLNQQLSNVDTYSDAVHTLMRRQLADGGGAATDATQGTGPAPQGSNATPFKNNREWSDAKKDSRYGSDMTYTRQVDARYQATGEFALGS